MTPGTWLKINGTISAVCALALITVGMMYILPPFASAALVAAGVLLTFVSGLTFRDVPNATWESESIAMGPGFTVLIVGFVITQII